MHLALHAIARCSFSGHPRDFPRPVAFARKWLDHADELYEYLGSRFVHAAGKRTLCLTVRVKNVVDLQSYPGPGVSAGPLKG